MSGSPDGRSESEPRQAAERSTEGFEAALDRMTRVMHERHTQKLEATIPHLVAVLAAAGIDAILLKGPVTRQRLYTSEEVRPTADIDLLVSARHQRRARAALGREGFERIALGGHSDTLQRGRVFVDLHLTLPFAAIPPSRAFTLLMARSVPITVSGHAITCLDEPAHVVHLALHAAQNEFDPSLRPLAEWRRGVASLTDEQLQSATELAGALHVLPVWDAARAAIEPGADVAALAAGLPRRKPPPTPTAVWWFARADLPVRVRWRAAHAFLHRQLSDEILVAWRADRGLPPVEPSSWSSRRAKATRIIAALRR